jgi:hypothetical protein
MKEELHMGAKGALGLGEGFGALGAAPWFPMFAFTLFLILILLILGIN